MKNDIDAVCTGCGRKAGDVEEYDDENPVQEDGTYADHLFVCTDCYVQLVPINCDVGSPLEIQHNARKYCVKGKGEEVAEENLSKLIQSRFRKGS